MDTLPKLFLLILPFFALAAAMEGWYLQKRRGVAYDWRAYFASLGDAVGRRLIVTLIGFGAVGVLLELALEHRLATVPMDQGWSWRLLFLGEEFCYYWMHRADHCVRWLWATHSVHHSSNQFVLANAYRLGWTTQISGTALFMAPLVLFGFPPSAVLAMLAANLLYQYWIHTELVGRLGPLEWILNTPAHHRVHTQPRVPGSQLWRCADRVRPLVRHLSRRTHRYSLQLRSCPTTALAQPRSDRVPRLGRHAARIARGVRCARSDGHPVRPARETTRHDDARAGP